MSGENHSRAGINIEINAKTGEINMPITKRRIGEWILALIAIPIGTVLVASAIGGIQYYMDDIKAWLTIAALAVAYFIPAIIAWHREHHNTLAIFILNIVAGWTMLGWLGSLIWSLTAVRKQDSTEP